MYHSFTDPGQLVKSRTNSVELKYGWKDLAPQMMVKKELKKRVNIVRYVWACMFIFFCMFYPHDRTFWGFVCSKGHISRHLLLIPVVMCAAFQLSIQFRELKKCRNTILSNELIIWESFRVDLQNTYSEQTNQSIVLYHCTICILCGEHLF